MKKNPNRNESTGGPLYCGTIKIACLVLMWWVGFITPAYSFDPGSIVGVGGPELSPELKRLITDVLRPSFQSAGYFPGLLQRSEFIEKIVPGQHFHGEKVLSHIDKMLAGLNGPDRQENLKVLEAICKFYVDFFKDYIHRKSFGGFLTPRAESSEKARSLILHSVHACYTFSEHGQKRVTKIEPITKSGIQETVEVDNFLERYPLRLRLTRLIINIFMLNREEKGIALQEDIYRRRKKLYTLLEGFHDEVSDILTTFLQRGVVQAKTVLQGLSEFMILLQEHALNISMWNMLVRYGQEQARRITLTTISILGVAGALMFTWKKLMPQTDVEKLASQLVTSWPTVEKNLNKLDTVLKDAPDQINKVTAVAAVLTEVLNAVKEKVKATPASTPEKLTEILTRTAVSELARTLGGNSVLTTRAERDTFIAYIKDIVETVLKVNITQDLIVQQMLKTVHDRKKEETMDWLKFFCSELHNGNSSWGSFFSTVCNAGPATLTSFSRLAKIVVQLKQIAGDEPLKAREKALKVLEGEIEKLPASEFAEYEKEINKVREIAEKAGLKRP